MLDRSVARLNERPLPGGRSRVRSLSPFGKAGVGAGRQRTNGTGIPVVAYRPGEGGMVNRRWRSLLLAAAIVTLLAVACEAAPTSPLPTATAAPGPTLSPTPPVTAAPGPVLSPTPPVTAAPGPTSFPTPRPALGSNFTGGPPIPESSLTTLEADPDWREALAGLRIDRRIWKTDFRFHTVPYSDIFSGGVPRDGIAPLDEPKFITLQEAADWLAPLEPVVALEINGDSRAYPLQILTWHEIVNDEVGGVPVAVTFCPCAIQPSPSNEPSTVWCTIRHNRQTPQQRSGDVGPADPVVVATVDRRSHRRRPLRQPPRVPPGVHNLLAGLPSR